MDSLGIYVSVPFCRSKCSFCNFASAVVPQAEHEGYIDRVVGQIRGCRAAVSSFAAELPETVDSVYLGGGTPSILSPLLLRRLFAALHETFHFAPSAEITVECAPGQVTDKTLAALVECGVNRISFGVQSFVDREAAVTGRLHHRRCALDDIERVRAAGIRSINVDLVAGLPHQTSASWCESLDVLLSAGTDHASIYMLEVDENSRLGRELILGGNRYHAGAAPAEDLVADFYSEAVEALQEGGLAQYEISNFARKGAESSHSKKYWLRHPYVGFGLDASSMLHGRGPASQGVRFRTADELPVFLAQPDFIELTPVTPQQALEEAWFLGLRLNEGVSLADLQQEFGASRAHRHDWMLSELESDGFLVNTDGRVRLTALGRLMSNEIFERFLSGSSVEEPVLVLVDG